MAPSDPGLPDVGVGLTYSSAIEPVLARAGSLVDLVEIEPQTVWTRTGDPDEPYRVSDEVMEHLRGLPGRKLVHSIGAPVGGTVRPHPAEVELLRQSVEYFEAPYASEHLSFNATPEFSTGFFLPPRQTPAGVANAAAAVQELRAALGVPLAVETGVNYLRPRPDDMADGAFAAAVAARADCGILLDLHNIWANELNGRQPVAEFLAQLDPARVWEMHLAGGFEMDGFWLDAHSGAVPDPLYDLAWDVVTRLPNLKAIVFEIFPAFIGQAGPDLVIEQLRRLQALWERRGTAVVEVTAAPPLPAPESKVGPAEWERALGGLVLGRHPAGDAAASLEEDPGIPLVGKMIEEFRASMIVSVLRLTSRLLMLAIGADAFRTILADFWSKHPPRQDSAGEAQSFGAYLEDLDLQLPRLGDVLAFERAVLATLLDDQTRLVEFDYDPLPMLRALAEGRLPEHAGQPVPFEIEITADGPLSVSGMSADAVRQTFPFH